MPSATLIARHRVQDYDAWRKVYDNLDGARREYGCTDDEVLVDPEDRREVFVLHRFSTLEQAHAFAGSTELKEAMEHGGVIGAPRIEIVSDAD